MSPEQLQGRFDANLGGGLAISPDGKTVAYVAPAARYIALRLGKRLVSRSARPFLRMPARATVAKPSDRVKLLNSESNALYASGAGGHGYLLWCRNGE
jgi:hypothetical protein